MAKKCTKCDPLPTQGRGRSRARTRLRFHVQLTSRNSIQSLKGNHDRHRACIALPSSLKAKLSLNRKPTCCTAATTIPGRRGGAGLDHDDSADDGRKKGCPFLYSTQWQARREAQISAAGLEEELFDANCKIEVLSNDSKPCRVRE